MSCAQNSQLSLIPTKERLIFDFTMVSASLVSATVAVAVVLILSDVTAAAAAAASNDRSPTGNACPVPGYVGPLAGRTVPNHSKEIVVNKKTAVAEYALRSEAYPVSDSRALYGQRVSLMS